jgi:hypothetical protein
MEARGVPEFYRRSIVARCSKPSQIWSMRSKMRPDLKATVSIAGVLQEIDMAIDQSILKLGLSNKRPNYNQSRRSNYAQQSNWQFLSGAVVWQ